MTQEIKRQARELCRGQKGLYLVALIYSFLVTAGGVVGYFLPQGEALTLGLTLVAPAVKLLLSPSHWDLCAPSGGCGRRSEPVWPTYFGFTQPLAASGGRWFWASAPMC